MTARITYLPGPWLALVRHGHLVLLPGSTDPGHVDGLWEALDGSTGVEKLLSAVLSARGLALTGMDPFGIVSLEADVHTILRGPVSLAAEGHELSTHVNGHGVTTWMERRIPRQEGLDIALDDVLRQHDGGDQHWLPITEGIIGFGRLHVDLPEEAPGEIEPLSAPQPIVPPADVGQAETAAVTAAGAAPAAVDAEPRPTEQRSVKVSEWEPGSDINTDIESPPEPEPEPQPSEPEPEPEHDPVSAEDADDANTIMSSSTLEGAPEAPARVGEPVSDDTIAGPHPADEELPDPEVLIDAVPWLAAARAQARADAAEADGGAAPRVEPGAPDHDLDDLPTISSAPRAAATQPAGGQPAGGADGEAHLGDHDGDTVMRGDLPTQVLPVAPAAGGSQPDPATGPQVLGRLCPAGHANPPTSSTCARCGEPLSEDPREVPRPTLGRMVISDGEAIELDRPAVVGRQPSVRRSASGSMPRVVQVKSPSGDISRSHLEIQLEGWHVMLVDLKATNGTMLVRAGMPPRRLGQGEKLMLLDGDIADLGDGVSLRFEGLL